MKTLLMILICLNLFACTSAYRVGTKDNTNEELILKLNSYAQNRSATVFLSSGQQYKGKNLRIADKTLFWTDEGGDRSCSTDSVYKIQFTKRGPMGLKTALGFLASMTVIGLISDAASGPQEGQMASATAMGFIGGVVYSPVAFLVGYLMGERTDYVFGQAPSQHVLLEDVKILKETASEVKIEWKGQTVWLFKSQIERTKTDGKISIRIKKELYQMKFQN